MDPTSFPPDTQRKQRDFIAKGIFLKVKLVVICTMVHVIMQGMVQPKEEILILTFRCSQLPALAPCEAAPGGCGAVPSPSYLTLDTKATEGTDERNTRFQKLNSFKRKKPNSESRYYCYSTGLFCILQEITSDCTKHFKSTEVIQKSCLVSKFPNLKSHS